VFDFGKWQIHDDSGAIIDESIEFMSPWFYNFIGFGADAA
jgi:hypothetical protein